MSELATYAAFLDDLRERVRTVLLGLYGEGLNWRPLAAANSIYGLAQHAAWVEVYWVSTVVGAQPFPYDWGNNADLAASGEDTAELLTFLDEAAAHTAAALAVLSDSELGAVRQRTRRDGQAQEFTVRWCLIHTIAHYTEHIGQMELTRQLWEARGA